MTAYELHGNQGGEFPWCLRCNQGGVDRSPDGKDPDDDLWILLDGRWQVEESGVCWRTVASTTVA